MQNANAHFRNAISTFTEVMRQELDGRSWRKYYLVNAALRRDKFKLGSNLNLRQLVISVVSATLAMRRFSIRQLWNELTQKRVPRNRSAVSTRDSTFRARINLWKSHVPGTSHGDGEKIFLKSFLNYALSVYNAHLCKHQVNKLYWRK